MQNITWSVGLLFGSVVAERRPLQLRREDGGKRRRERRSRARWRRWRRWRRRKRQREWIVGRIWRRWRRRRGHGWFAWFSGGHSERYGCGGGYNNDNTYRPRPIVSVTCLPHTSHKRSGQRRRRYTRDWRPTTTHRAADCVHGDNCATGMARRNWTAGAETMTVAAVAVVVAGCPNDVGSVYPRARTVTDGTGVVYYPIVNLRLIVHRGDAQTGTAVRSVISVHGATRYTGRQRRRDEAGQCAGRWTGRLPRTAIATSSPTRRRRDHTADVFSPLSRCTGCGQCSRNDRGGKTINGRCSIVTCLPRNRSLADAETV